jgi:hypothetical protein
MTGRPGWPRRTFQVQNKRKPARCQAMTVSGLTMASAERQALHTRDRQSRNRQRVARWILTLSGSPSFVAVMTSADLRHCHDGPHFRQLNRSLSPSPTKDGFSIGDSNRNPH